MGCGGGHVAEQRAAPRTINASDNDFVARRLAICEACQHSSDGVCRIVELKHDDQAFIANGVVRPDVRCPIGKWPEEQVICPQCGRKTLVPDGGVCRWCAYQNSLAQQRQIGVVRAKHIDLESFTPLVQIDWFVGVTTAPRKKPTLHQCLQSVRAAGWNPVVFSEPGSTITDAETFVNLEKLGVWRNWLSLARYALDSSDANVILTLQDDALLHPDSKQFIERMLWPSHRAGMVSLYTPSHYSTWAGSRSGLFSVHTRSMWGAVAMVFPRDVLRSIVNHPLAKAWTGSPPRSGSKLIIKRRIENPSLIANSDTAIGHILNSLGKAAYYFNPSPVAHIGKTSTIKHGDNSGKRNCGYCADHGIPLADQIEL